MNQNLDLEEILKGKNEDELIRIILDCVDCDANLGHLIKSRYAFDVEIKLSSSKALILSYIESAKDKNYIRLDRVHEAMQGAWLVLEKARELSDTGDPAGAISLCLVVLPITVDIIEYCDDSGAGVSMVIQECLDILDKAIQPNNNAISLDLRKRLSAALRNEANQLRYNDWLEYRTVLIALGQRLLA